MWLHLVTSVTGVKIYNDIVHSCRAYLHTAADTHHVLLQDPVTGHPAVMAFVHNITQQKQVEMQLAQHQEVLQR